MSIKIKRTAVLSQAKDCHIQNDRPGFSQLKGLSMRITIKTTAGECHNQNNNECQNGKDRQIVLHSK